MEEESEKLTMEPLVNSFTIREAALLLKKEELSQGPTQVAQGNVTYIGIIVAALPVIFKILGKPFPMEEVQAFAQWLDSTIPTIVQGAALAVAVYGRMRREWR